MEGADIAAAGGLGAVFIRARVHPGSRAWLPQRVCIAFDAARHVGRGGTRRPTAAGPRTPGGRLTDRSTGGGAAPKNAHAAMVLGRGTTTGTTRSMCPANRHIARWSIARCRGRVPFRRRWTPALRVPCGTPPDAAAPALVPPGPGAIVPRGRDRVCGPHTGPGTPLAVAVRRRTGRHASMASLGARRARA